MQLQALPGVARGRLQVVACGCYPYQTWCVTACESWRTTAVPPLSANSTRRSTQPSCSSIYKRFTLAHLIPLCSHTSCSTTSPTRHGAPLPSPSLGARPPASRSVGLLALPGVACGRLRVAACGCRPAASDELHTCDEPLF